VRGLGIVNVAPGRVDLWELDLPEPGPRDVVVDTRYSMISPGTERSVLLGERFYGRASGYRRDLPPFPQVGGYQKVGVVLSAGREVRSVAEGDWVFCTVGATGLAEFPRGGHVRPSIQPEDQVLKLPDGVDPVLASGLVLTQVGYSHASRPPVGAGTRALVIGDGLVGQWTAEALQLRGAAVLLAGHHDGRMARCRLAGDSRRVNTLRTPLEQAAAEFCPGGFPVIVDTRTDAEALHEAVGFLRHNGHLVAGGYYVEGRNLIDYTVLTSKETTLHTPGGWQRDRLEATLELVASGRVEVAGKITHRLGLSEYAKAFGLLLSRTEDFLGMVIDWTPS
jgi:2-desacetyl-2-hydroxyethyl bacteriochlorophyllide A dehydrogenase